jgi:hypothetical protein
VHYVLFGECKAAQPPPLRRPLRERINHKNLDNIRDVLQ